MAILVRTHKVVQLLRVRKIHILDHRHKFSSQFICLDYESNYITYLSKLHQKCIISANFRRLAPWMPLHRQALRTPNRESR